MWATQSADEVLDWNQDWTDWVPTGDVITSSDWTIHPYGPTLSGATLDAQNKFTTITVADLEPGISYQLLNIVVTNMGRVGSREIIIRCGQI